jgi:hypothetical protein
MLPFRAWIVKLPQGGTLRHDKLPVLYRTRDAAQQVATERLGTVHQVKVKIDG